jgi:spore coat protein A, manganese oxidase
MSKGKTFTRRQMLKGGAIAGAGFLVPWPSITSKVFAGSPSAAGMLATTTGVPVQPGPSPIGDFTDGNYFKQALVSAIPFAKPKYRIPGVVAYYELEMKEFPGFPFYLPNFGVTGKDPVAAKTWGYSDGTPHIFNGGNYIGYLGPTIETRRNEQVIVKWINSLPAGDGEPFGLLDPTLIPGYDPNTGTVPDRTMINDGPLGGRATVHIHGMHTASQFDGGPENGFNPGSSRVYYYPNIQEAANLWYHDHAVGVTRLNAYAGLAALYWIRDAVEDRLNLPNRNAKDKFGNPLEIPLVLQDKAFYKTGNTWNLWYPNPWQPESFGNTIVINAQLWPTLKVEPRRYRFRMYNGANARVFRLRLSDGPTPGSESSWTPNSAGTFYQIGAEAGLMPNAAPIDTLLLANGERADVVIDFSRLKGKTVYLSNDAMTPFDPGQPPLAAGDLDPIYGAFANLNVMLLMKIEVDGVAVTDTSRNPATQPSLRAPIALSWNNAAQFRQITLVERPDLLHPDPAATPPVSGLYADWTNYYKKVLVNNRLFMVGDGAFTETPKLGTSEVWQYVNLTPDTHPMHMHLVAFKVLGRQKLALNPEWDALVAAHPDDPPPEYLRYAYGAANAGSQVNPVGDLRNQTAFVTGVVMPPDVNETGWKETVKTNPGEVTYVIAKFEDFPGKFVYHCHILDHEENDMMQYMQTKLSLGKDGEGEEVLPNEFALEQNFPNPFNPATQIRFQMPKDGHATLRIFNAGGQEVAKLVDGQLPAGSHAVSWDASRFATGVYFYRLEAGSFSAVKKMLFLK